MLRWTVIFLVVAIVAAIFGFGGIAESAAGIAKILFFRVPGTVCNFNDHGTKISVN